MELGSVTLKINNQHTLRDCRGRGDLDDRDDRPPCWRTLKESCKGLGSVSLKINNQHTHREAPLACGLWSCRFSTLSP
jgi:hypothetical protein